MRRAYHVKDSIPLEKIHLMSCDAVIPLLRRGDRTRLGRCANPSVSGRVQDARMKTLVCLGQSRRLRRMWGVVPFHG
jgi:hypothetical protein